VERACSLAETDYIQQSDLPDYVIGGSARPAALPAAAGSAAAAREGEAWTHVPSKTALRDMPFKEAKEEWISSFERDYILDLIQRHNGNISQAAREADIDRKYFRKLMDKYDIEGADAGD
jgi:DNA-binding NtrC family response regulator